MKDPKRILCMLLSIVIAVCLAACGKTEQEETGITGTWETTVNILGADVESGKTGTMAFRFDKDMTGQLIAPEGTGGKPESFTYSLTEDTLEIVFSSGDTWSFPYQLEGDTLTLTQNHAEVLYTRAK